MKITFSIIIVTLNVEKEIIGTVNSILKQTYKNYEIIIKDGFSSDHTIDNIPQCDCIKIIQKRDCGIYDAMNQAIDICLGEYIIFLNAGDTFYNNYVLENIKKYIETADIKTGIFYGDYERNHEFVIKQDSRLSDFKLYRKPLCHQSIIYERNTLQNCGKFNTSYKISADHDFTVGAWKAGVPFQHVGAVICNYKGAGISESKSGFKRAVQEKKSINKKYFSAGEYIKFKIIRQVTFPWFRRWIDSEKSPAFLKNAYRLLRNMISR